MDPLIKRCFSLLFNKIDFQPESINLENQEVGFSLTVINCFKIPNLSISFKNHSLNNYSQLPVRILKNALRAHIREITSQNLIHNEDVFLSFKDLFKGEIDILPFSTISKKIGKSISIPVDRIEIGNIGFYEDVVAIEGLHIGHYLYFYNQPLKEVDGEYILRDDCLVKDKKIVSCINEMLSKKTTQKRIYEALKSRSSKTFYFGLEINY